MIDRLLNERLIECVKGVVESEIKYGKTVNSQLEWLSKMKTTIPESSNEIDLYITELKRRYNI